MLQEIDTNETTPAVAAPPRLSVVHRFLGNGLLAYICYATLFVGLFNSGTNALQVGRQVLIARDPTNSTPDGDTVRFIGIVTLTILCLMQYFYATLGRRLNVTVAVLKIIFLIILLGGGASSAINHRYGAPTFTECSPLHRSTGYAKALLLVIFSYEGWENANFVSQLSSFLRPCSANRGTGGRRDQGQRPDHTTDWIRSRRARDRQSIYFHQLGLRMTSCRSIFSVFADKL